MVKRKIVITFALACMAVVVPASAASFRFSFITTTTQTGGIDTKPYGDSSFFVTPDIYANLSNNKVVYVYIGADTRILSETLIFNAPGIKQTGFYSAEGQAYSGEVELRGNPNKIGVCANGLFEAY